MASPSYGVSDMVVALLGYIAFCRYMQFRERESSSSTLGFRLEGVKVGSNPGTTDFKKIKTRDDVCGEMTCCDV